MEIYRELLETVLPEKLLDYFELKSVRKIDNVVTMRLIEKEWVPEIPKEYRGKKITSKGFKDFLVDDFPLRGKRVKLQLKRRVWKIEGVTKLLRRNIPITFPNTKLDKEFALFLKGGNRKGASRDFENSKDVSA